jgi:predicted amidophosphoribosyltransferase
MLFLKGVQFTIKNINNVKYFSQNFKIVDGTDVIKRILDTKTTHIKAIDQGNLPSPYKNITKETCEIKTQLIKDKFIILIDDVYTLGVNVIEDCLQVLLESNPRDIIVYTIGKTVRK